MNRRRRIFNGKKFGRLTVLKDVQDRITPKGKTMRYVECLCKCGTIKEISICSLLSGKTKSCGCYRKERIIQINTINGKYARTKKLTFRNEKHSVTKWSEITGIHPITIISRIENLGWTVTDALTIPPTKHIISRKTFLMRQFNYVLEHGTIDQKFWQQPGNFEHLLKQITVNDNV